MQSEPAFRFEGVQSFRDLFIGSRIQTETGIAGRFTAERDALSPVEAALQGSENGGLNNALNGFFGAFRDLEANPNSVPLRGIIAQKGAKFNQRFSINTKSSGRNQKRNRRRNSLDG